MKVLLDPAEVKVNPKTGNPDKRITTGQFKRWQPKVWTPIMEQMVVLSCANYSNTAIATVFKCTAQHVSNILNCNEGIRLRAKIIDGIKVTSELSITDRLKDLATTAISNIETIIKSQNAMNEQPMAMFDKSIKVLELTKHIESPKQRVEGGINVNGNAIISIGHEHAEQLIEGLAKANEAAKLHGNVEVMERKPNDRLSGSTSRQLEIASK